MVSLSDEYFETGMVPLIIIIFWQMMVTKDEKRGKVWSSKEECNEHHDQNINATGNIFNCKRLSRHKGSLLQENPCLLAGEQSSQKGMNQIQTVRNDFIRSLTLDVKLASLPIQTFNLIC